MKSFRSNSTLRELVYWLVQSTSVILLGVLLTQFRPGGSPPEVSLVEEPSPFDYEIPDLACLQQDVDWDFHSNSTEDRGFIAFKEFLAFKESGGDYGVVNTLGYLGKYQFGQEALNDCGVFDYERFLRDPRLQEEVFAYYTYMNRMRLERYIKIFNNKRVKGVLITESGLLAAAHLGGVGSVKKFLNTAGEFDSEDVYGSSLSYYMSRFSGYQLEEFSLTDTLNGAGRMGEDDSRILVMNDGPIHGPTASAIPIE